MEQHSCPLSMSLMLAGTYNTSEAIHCIILLLFAGGAVLVF